jgi:ankyrin repeat protein
MLNLVYILFNNVIIWRIMSNNVNYFGERVLSLSTLSLLAARKRYGSAEKLYETLSKKRVGNVVELIFGALKNLTEVRFACTPFQMNKKLSAEDCVSILDLLTLQENDFSGETMRTSFIQLKRDLENATGESEKRGKILDYINSLLVTAIKTSRTQVFFDTYHTFSDLLYPRNYLMCAFSTGNLEIIEFLLSKAYPAHRFNDKSPAQLLKAYEEDLFTCYQYTAAFSENLAAVLPILDKTSFAKSISFLSSLLFYAVGAGDLEHVKLFVERGALLDNSCDIENFYTPLHYAIKSEHEEIALYLLSCNNVRLDLFDSKGHSVLHAAVEQEMAKTVEIILQKTNSQKDAFGVNGRTRSLITPLHVAAMKGNKEIATLLVTHKARSNLRDLSGKTPLDYARENGAKEVAAYLEGLGLKSPVPMHTLDKTKSKEAPAADFEVGSGRNLEQLNADLFARLFEEKQGISTSDRVKLLNVFFKSEEWEKLKPLMLQQQEYVLKILADQKKGAHLKETLTCQFLMEALTAATRVSSPQAFRFLLLLMNAFPPKNGKSLGEHPLIKNAVIEACRFGQKEMVQASLTIYSSSQLQDFLCAAIQSGHLEIVTLLVDAGASIDKELSSCQKPFNPLPLSLAAQLGHLDIVMYLVSKKAALDQIRSKSHGKYFFRPFDYALRGGREEIVTYFSQKEAPSGLPLVEQLALIIKSGNINLFKQWLSPKKQLDLNTETQTDSSLLSLPPEDQLDPNAETQNDSSLLSPPPEDQLDPNTETQNDSSLLSLPPEKQLDLNTETQKGGLLLIAAILQGIDEMVALLIEKGANPNKPDAAGRDPFVFAARFGNPKTMSLLLERMEEEVLNCLKENALYHAVAYGNVANADLLLELEQGKAISAKAKNIITHKAIEKSHFQCVRLMVERKAPITEKNELGDTVLHTAVTRALGHELLLPNASILAYLLTRNDVINGNLVHALDKKGLSPLQAAVANKRMDPAIAVELLLQSGANPDHLPKRYVRDEKAAEIAKNLLKMFSVKKLESID